MNARLSSLLVAGGVVLAGIQSGSLTGATPELGLPPTIVTLQGASFQPAGSGAVLTLAIPGFTGVPRLQVLTKPSRVVVDLPGVNRGLHPSKKDLQSFASPLILRSRIAQFLADPNPITRLVLEVVDGTQVEVSSDAAGISLALTPGKGGVEVQYASGKVPTAVLPPKAPMETEAVAAKAPAMDEPFTVVPAPVLVADAAATPLAAVTPAETVPAPQPAVASPMTVVSTAPVAVVVAEIVKPVPEPVPAIVAPVAPVAPAVAVVAEVVKTESKPAPEPVPALVAPVAPAVAVVAEVVKSESKPAPEPVPALVAPAAPAVAVVAEVVKSESKPAPEPTPAVVAPTVALVASVTRPAPEPFVAAPSKPEPGPAVVAAAPKPAPAVAMVAKVKPLPLPAVGAPFQTLPVLAVSSLLPVTPGMAQDRAQDPHPDRPSGATPMVPHPENRRDEYRSGRTLGDATTHYTGTRMSIDVTGTDLISFLRIIAETAHLNLIADQDVQGTYTFKFTDTPWDQVLDVILKHVGLGKEVSNGIIRVAKIEKLQKEEEDRKRLDDARALSGELQSITRPLSFAKASEAKVILEKVLTKRGSLIIDERTNTLIISELPRNIALIDDLIAQLDVQIQQVQIEARVVEATKNFQKAFGVQWPTANTGAAAITTANNTTANWGSYNGQSWNSINNLATANGNSAALAFSPGAAGVTSLSAPAGQFWLSFLSNRMSINVILQALETEGVVKIISSPKVVTQNNKKAKVLSGSKIPYPSQQGGAAGGAITVAFVDANLELDVTPQITNDGTILMDIHVEKSAADFSTTVNGTPTISRKVVDTQVLVKDGGTAIMGGVYTNQNTKSQTGVPFLSKLPLIGFLFRTTNDADSNDELLVFITPRILKN